MNILLVEDEPGVALVLEYALGDVGHKIIGPVAMSATAYSLALNKRPDLALIDINLADGRTGPVLAQRLMNDLNIPSLYITGDNKAALTARNGALGYITKPYDLRTVIEALKAVEEIIDGGKPSYIPVNLQLFASAPF